MSDNRSQGSFMDQRTIVAIILVGVVFFGYQSYLGKKYPDYYKQQQEQQQQAATEGESSKTAETDASVAAPTSPAPAAGSVVQTGLPQVEKLVPYENEILSFQVSTRGMGLKGVFSKEFKDRNHKPIQFGADQIEPMFATRMLETNQLIDFEVSKAGDHSFVGTAKIGQTSLKKTLLIDPSTGRIESELIIEKPGPTFKGVATRFTEPKFIPQGGGWMAIFMPSIEHQEFVIRKEGQTERVPADYPDQSHNQSFANATMAAIGSQYFASAYADHSDILPTIEVNAPRLKELKPGQNLGDRPTEYVTVDVQYKPTSVGDRLQLKSVTYVGGKSLNRLETADPDFHEIVNLGIFASIGRILLKVLLWSHNLVNNWGWAIVILTLLVRVLVAPFNIASYRSMKKMQKISPMLQSLRERYKEDPATMNRESMALMREHKVNPMGGCLPMLLQMPVFFALYQVLGQSIELYQAPWIFWISDLSLKDPFYILPVLMVIVMWAQQKLTPMTNMDPNQAKILQWMPIIFGVFMLGLPSGLTLYIFVSTLFSVIQQKIFMRDTSKSPAILDVKAQRVH